MTFISVEQGFFFVYNRPSAAFSTFPAMTREQFLKEYTTGVFWGLLFFFPFLNFSKQWLSCVCAEKHDKYDLVVCLVGHYEQWLRG